MQGVAKIVVYRMGIIIYPVSISSLGRCFRGLEHDVKHGVYDERRRGAHDAAPRRVDERNVQRPVRHDCVVCGVVHAVHDETDKGAVHAGLERIGGALLHPNGAAKQRPDDDRRDIIHGLLRDDGLVQWPRCGEPGEVQRHQRGERDGCARKAAPSVALGPKKSELRAHVAWLGGLCNRNRAFV